MLKWTFKEFNYPTSTRAMVDGERVYSINDEKLPSVTTILQATQSDEKKQILENWKKKVGAANADAIRDGKLQNEDQCFIESLKII